MLNQAPWGPRRPPDADSSDTAERVYRAWRVTHVDGSVRAFWRAVDAGEVQLRSSNGSTASRIRMLPTLGTAIRPALDGDTAPLRTFRRNAAEPVTILIAEADPRLRRLLRGMIEPEGYTVLEAADGDQAWQMIQQRPPAVALLAVALPAWTGVELARALSVPRHRTTRVVLFARPKADAEPQIALADEATVSLAIPCTRAQLLGALGAALAGQASGGRPGAC